MKRVAFPAAGLLAILVLTLGGPANVAAQAKPMARLEGLKGAEFEIAFMQEMTLHHTMAREIAQLAVDELKDIFHFKKLPGERRGYYQTLGGFVMTYLGRITSASDRFEWGGLRFEVIDMDGHRVDMVLVETDEQLQDPHRG